ncbi:MAG: twin-arginine translocation signal domain-containing protein [Candidatus Acidiferrum sp.]
MNSLMNRALNRRSLLKTGALAGGAVAIGTGLMSSATPAFGQESEKLTPGDIAILRFLATAELIETDLWVQYAELGGLTSGVPIEVNANQSLNPYQAALSNLDTDGPQYITSNTLDELTHGEFLNGYLESKGAEPVNFDEFRTLQGSTATGSSGIPRLTNLMHLNVDTSWFVRYRSATNPDFGATFPQAVTITNRTAIPITDADFGDVNHIQVIANTAAFHFGYIEQGGSSLYQALGRKVSSLEVLKITQGIGGDEIAHFLEWVDFAGNGVQQPVAPVSDSGLTFPDFFALANPNEPFSPTNTNNPLIQPSLIFPVPCEFISPKLPHCSVIRPTDDKFAGAVATLASFTADGLFTGQSKKFLNLLKQLAEEADAAFRQF